MEQYLKRYFWVIQLVLVAGIAILAAMSVSNVGSALLAPFRVSVPTPADSGAKEEKAGPQTRLSNLDTARFAPKPSEDEQVEAEAAPDSEVDPSALASSDDYPVSDLRVKLTGTFVADDERWSMALLYDEASRGSFRTKVGESFLEVVKMSRIERDRVIIEREGRLEQIEIDSAGGAGKGSKGGRRGGLTSKPRAGAVSKPAWKSPATSAKNALSKVKVPTDKFASLRKGITKKNESSFEVTRDTLNSALKNPSQYRDSTRPVPKYNKGKLTGFELTKMGSGSIFSELGMRNGDIITSINGKKIRTPNDALRMYQKLGSASEVKIGYQRNGVDRENSYSIR